MGIGALSRPERAVGHNSCADGPFKGPEGHKNATGIPGLLKGPLSIQHS
jgi:hypothetical protein